MTYKLRLITSSIGWGGLERNLLVMAQWMTKAGHEVSYAAVEGSPSWNHAPSFGVTPEAIPHHPRRATVLDVRRWKQLAREADLVWIRAPRDLDVASRACRQTGTPLLVQQAMQISKPKTLWWHKRRYRTVNAWVSGLESLRAESLANTPSTPLKPMSSPSLWRLVGLTPVAWMRSPPDANSAWPCLRA